MVGAERGYAGDAPDRGHNLFLYLTKEGWPADFTYMIGRLLEGHDILQFHFVQRQLDLDVAVIENVSNVNVSLDGLFGTEIVSKTLRAVGASQVRSRSRAEQVAKDLGRLGPGEKLLVPLRMLLYTEFPYGVLPSGPDDDLAKAAQATYETIRAADPGTQGFRYPALMSSVAEGSVHDDGYRFITALKRPTDYKAPSYPTPKDYAYGPEIALRGVIVNGKRLDLQRHDPNMLTMTASSASGSCPYVLAWSDRLERWVDYGKVIHEAQGPELQDVEEVRLTEPSTRFRIAERELELSHIDQVRLRLELSDGRTVELVPDIPALSRVDGDYAEIYAGGTVELEFRLPDAIAREDIRSSSLSVNGYYQLYTSPEMLARIAPLPVSE